MSVEIESPTGKGKYWSRKFIVTVVVLTLATLMVLAEIISGDNWTNIALASVGAYNVANAVSRYRK